MILWFNSSDKIHWTLCPGLHSELDSSDLFLSLDSSDRILSTWLFGLVSLDLIWYFRFPSKLETSYLNLWTWNIEPHFEIDTSDLTFRATNSILRTRYFELTLFTVHETCSDQSNASTVKWLTRRRLLVQWRSSQKAASTLAAGILHAFVRVGVRTGNASLIKWSSNPD